MIAMYYLLSRFIRCLGCFLQVKSMQWDSHCR